MKIESVGYIQSPTEREIYNQHLHQIREKSLILHPKELEKLKLTEPKFRRKELKLQAENKTNKQNPQRNRD